MTTKAPVPVPAPATVPAPDFALDERAGAAGTPGVPVSAVALVVVLAMLAAALAYGLAGAFTVAGRLAAPLAAALGAVVALLPMAVMLVKLRRDVDRGLQQARVLSAADPVTGADSRPQFIVLAEREFARSRRYGNGAGLLLVDVDRFRRVLEGRDEAVGDAVMREIAQSILGTLRGADALARFGNAQLAVLLAQADPLGALDVAERIRERVERLDIVWRQERLHVTASVGVAMMRPAHLKLQAVIDDAEAALGAARHAGGNCVRAAPVDARRSQAFGPSVGDGRTTGPAA